LAGNLCTSSPCGDVSRALICLDASVEAVSVNTKRLIKLTDFFTGVKKNSLKDNELISRIIVPAAMAFRPGAHEKLKRIKGHDLALVSLSMIQALDSVRIAGGSCAPTPVLAVIDNPEPDLACVIEACEKTVCPVDDIRASADYRRFMIKKFAQRLMKKIKNGGLSK
jgi:carbon-monoxide dehydrogenase medium subunit